MEDIIYNHAPEYWDKKFRMKIIELNNRDEEYKQIQYEVRKALNNTNQKIMGIERYQSVYDFGQFLVRGQLLCHLNSSTYYKVRRFIIIDKKYLTSALDYNIDHRRCNVNLVFCKTLPKNFMDTDKVILVVQVLTHNKYEENITPHNSSDYFIEYIIKF